MPATLAANARSRASERCRTPFATDRPVPERVPGVASGGEEEALLRAIAAAPEDDAPRLVYADWLEDHGRDDHAAFVRVQCEFARTADVEGEWGAFDKSDRWDALQSRCEAAAPRREGAWAVPATVPVEVYRGLPAFVRCGPRDFVEHGREWLSAAPTLHGLRLTRVGRSVRDAQALADAEHLGQLTRLWIDRRASAAALETILASPRLAGLTHLDLFGFYLRNTAALTNARHLTRLTRLELSDARIGDVRFAELLRSPVVGRLAYLGLQGNGIRDDGARALAACHRMAGLTTLDLENNRLGAAGVRALATSPHLSRLRNLSLAGNDLGPPAARELARAAGLTGLVALNLSSNRLRDSGVRELLGGECLARLQRLDLGYDDLTDDAVEALAASDALAGLRSLTLSDEGIGNVGVLALAGSPHLANLRELEIQAEEVTAAGLKAGTSRLERLETLRVSVDDRKAALVACGLFGMPANLDLEGNGLSDAGAVALAAMPGMRNVVRLNLSFNGIGDRGARALAESPYLDNLEELNLHCNEVRAAGIEALVSGPGLPRLTRLVAGSNPLRAGGLKRLAASPGAARLTSLGLWFVEAGETGYAALARSPHLGNLRYLHLGCNRVSQQQAVRLIGSPNLPRLAMLTLGMGMTPEAYEALRVEAARRGIALGD